MSKSFNTIKFCRKL